MKKPVLRPAAPLEIDAPASFALADASALQALVAGDADPDQQKRALKWIIESACGTYAPAFRPGTDGARNTDFMLGRIFVGQQIVGLTKLNLSKLRRSENAAAA